MIMYEMKEFCVGGTTIISIEGERQVMKIGVGVFWEKFIKDQEFYMKTYDCLEIQDFVMPDNLDLGREHIIKQYQQQLQGYKGILTVHGPYIDLQPTSFDPLIRQASSARYHQCLEAAAALKCKYMIIHSSYDPMKAYDDGYDEYFIDQNTNFWKENIGAFEAYNVTVVLENIHDKGHQLIRKVLEKVNSPFLGACLDTGHAHALVKTDLLPWLEGYEHWLKYIHLHDNFGERDQHLSVGEGSINFAGFFKKLKEMNYDSILMNEIFGGVEAQKRNLENLYAFLK